jgi:hypothetical protein
MRTAIGCVLLALVSAGCGRSNPATALRYVDVGLDEDSHPVGIAVMVENKGRSPAKVSTTAALLDWKYLLAGQGGGEAIPASFDYDVGLPDISIPPGATKSVEFDFKWNVARITADDGHRAYEVRGRI